MHPLNDEVFFEYSHLAINFEDGAAPPVMACSVQVWRLKVKQVMERGAGRFEGGDPPV